MSASDGSGLPSAPEAQVRAGHTGHGRILHEGDLLDCLAVNRHHVGASRVWCGVVAMTLPKMAFSAAVRMADDVLAQAAFVAAELTATPTPLDATRRQILAASARRRKRARPAPRHAHQDPAGAEHLARVGAL